MQIGEYILSVKCISLKIHTFYILIIKYLLEKWRMNGDILILSKTWYQVSLKFIIFVNSVVITTQYFSEIIILKTKLTLFEYITLLN